MTVDVGFVGLGAMGRPMAANVARASHRVQAWNRSPVEAPDGVAVVDNLATVAGDSDVTVVMVSDAEAVRAVLFGDEGWLTGAGDDAVLVQSSTIGPGAMRDIAEACQERGVRIVDAPVSGSVAPAERGELTVLAGGEPADIDAAAPVFDAIASRVVRCGGVGSGSAAKLAVNAMLVATMSASAEALTWLVDTEPDLSLDDFRPVLERISPLVARRADALVGDPPANGFSLTHVDKDMGLVCEAMSTVPVLEAVRDRARAAVEEEGLADRDLSGLGLAVRRLRDAERG